MRVLRNPAEPRPFRPERKSLTPRQLDRLAAVSGVPRVELKPKFTELTDRLRFIDPELLFFRKICGRVVKRDPVTGAEVPVAASTVEVQDTDCKFLGFFPTESPYCWLFPVSCQRETIATVQTDDCGNFCVLVPRFEIDWILRWRLRRQCDPLFLTKPNLRDLATDLSPSGPRPFPVFDAAAVEHLRPLEPIVGRRRLRQLAGQGRADHLLDAPAFAPGAGQPPAFPELHSFAREPQKLAELMRLPLDEVKAFHPQRWLGPFWRCRWTLEPTFTPLIDVPDLTFRVTQDTNGDGVPEVIYDESLGDVRWNSGDLPPVVLVASDQARTSLGCGAVVDFDCGVDTLGINSIGDYPVHPDTVAPGAFLDAQGYAVRVNRPHPDGTPGGAPEPDSVLSTAPFTGSLVLRGCNAVQGATHYRIRYRHNGGPEQVLIEPSGWYLEREMPAPRGVIHVTQDPQGWAEILDPTTIYYLFRHILVPWSATRFPAGQYELWLEFKNAGGVLPVTSPVVPVQVDNAAPHLEFLSVAWHGTAHPAPTELPQVCAVIRRNAGETVTLTTRYRVTAAHLRSASIAAGGCGAGSPTPTSPASTRQNYYTDPTDNTVLETAVFEIPAGLPDGAYSVSLSANSRAFAPSFADGSNPLTNDWNVETSSSVPAHATFPISLVTQP